MLPKKKKPLKTNINFIINMQVYPFDVMVSIAQEDVQLGYSLNRFGPLPVEQIESARYTNDNCTGRYVMFSTGASLIRMRKLPETPEDYGTLAHEITHIVVTVLDRVGMKLVIEASDEAYTYLTQFLTENIYKQINKYY
jgi:hypothetical protein